MMNKEQASETALTQDAELSTASTELKGADANITEQFEQNTAPPQDEPSIDMESLNRVLSMNFEREPAVTPVRQPPADLSDGTAGLSEEIAEDMLELLRRVTNIERAQSDLSLRLEQIETTLRDTARQYASEVEKLRRELLGERKALSALSVFNAVVPMLDSLRVMRAHLNKSKQAPVHQQLDALIQALSTTLRSLGFVEFEAIKNEPFDPARMECLGFASGRPGIVLNAIRPGYRVQEVVARPAGVMLSDPANAAKARSTEEL